MDPWRKESLNLKVGDFIIWKDEAIELEGQTAVATPGMKGKVISLHDGFHLDVAEVYTHWIPGSNRQAVNRLPTDEQCLSEEVSQPA